ncbi:transcriptional activator RinB [Staphylococcus shinii]|uniref:transcriptional activator RinB n=1 Tax=Staphylococcus shinii TaxID=2912228 RepID=UPI003F5640F5
MAKYMIKNIDGAWNHLDRNYKSGDFVEIKKLKQPIKIGSKKFEYEDIDNDILISKKFLENNFTKGTYKSETPKRIFKTLLIIALYELSKEITYEIIVKKQANDMVEVPGYDEIDLWKKL